MDTPYPCTLIGNQFPEVIIPDNNFKPKLKAQAGFVINIVVLCPSLYPYHDEVMIDEMMEEFIICQIPNVQTYII